MSNDHSPPVQDPANTSPRPSYVYPVRSLLTGIQPAKNRRSSLDDKGRHAASRKKPVKGLHRSSSSSDLPSPSNLASKDPFDDAHDRSGSSGQTRTITSPSPPTSHGKCKRASPNFRDFHPNQSPFSPRTFSAALPAPRGSRSALRADVLFTLGPVGDSLAHLSQADRDSDVYLDIYNPRHPPSLSEVVADAFADVTSRSALIPQAAADAVDDDGIDRIVPDSALIPANMEDDRDAGILSPLSADFSPGEPPIPGFRELVPFSQTGIVHLGPLGDTADGQSGSRSSTGGPSPGPRYSPGSKSRSHAHSKSPRVSAPASFGGRDANSPSLSADASRSSSNPPSSPLVSRSDSDGSGVSAPRQHMTLRYQHVEDENGHHLIVGREGKLTRCEDEPIRTPGAVQGFGILVAVEEDNETGNLIVRQVSENSTELLGLSPSYLFGLECFSQTFPEQQADVLFDNIQYLSETSVTSEEQAENHHVFMLSGYGEPGSAFHEALNLGRGDPQGRRTWTCWCAAHRPQMTSPANLASGESRLDNAYQNIIILEFELERDSFNLLYPSPSVSEDGSLQSGVSSPSNQSMSASASNSSGRTLVSQTSEGSTSISTPEGLACGRSALLTGSSGTGSLPSALSPALSSLSQAHNVAGDDDWLPSAEDVLESTTSRAKPLPALERLRRTRQPGAMGGVLSPDSGHGTGSGSGTGDTSTSARGGFRRRRGTGAVGMMDVFAVMAQINEQLGAAPDLDTFLKVTVGVMKDLTQFHRVLVYQFDEAWNGQVVAELVDWNQTHDLYRGLHFPAADIPAQARELYALNKVRLLYDRELPTARLVVRSKEDLDKPLDMTHCYLRAMSPIHLKYLENMGVRASMSVSIIAFGTLWGLVACHSYGPHGMRVSFPVRQMLRLLSQSISRNIERLSYAQRLHTRKLINTMSSDQHPSGYIVSNADDLLGLFDADYGVLVIGEGAKILGPNQHGQEILIVAEYLRLKQFNALQVSQAVTVDYPDLRLTTGLEIIAGLLYVPLSAGGRDFIVFLRKGQPRQVKWAGRPHKGDGGPLEPRASFKTWAEIVAGRCRVWTDEHLETAGVLALVYGKFIEVWRQKESALQTTKLTNLLLSNASHEVRTPLNHIINYLELALNGPLDKETRENLSQSHAASKSLLFTINDLLDLTRLESGNEIAFNEPFNLHQAIDEATHLYRNEACRRDLKFNIDLQNCPRQVVGDCKKMRTVVANLTANALKYTTQGEISVVARPFDEPTGLRNSGDVAIEIVVSDSGCGIPSEKLESIFREFEQVESAPQHAHLPGLGLGLAVVARIVEQLGGQLRVDSTLGKGSRFSFLIPLTTETSSGGRLMMSSPSPNSSQTSLAHDHSVRSLPSRNSSRGSEIDSLVEAISSSHMDDSPRLLGSSGQSRMVDRASPLRGQNERGVEIQGSANPLKPVKVDEFDLDSPVHPSAAKMSQRTKTRSPDTHRGQADVAQLPKLRILIVEDNDINRTILAKRLSLDGHTVVNTTNGQEGLEVIVNDPNFDCVLMDIQMPLLNGYEATKCIRAVEQDKDLIDRVSHKLNGRLPIFAVSASLFETQREELYALGMDGWILKPIDFKRLRTILHGVVDPSQREKDVYHPTANWEAGGWLSRPSPQADS